MERRVEKNIERNNPRDTKVSEEGQKVPQADIHVQPMQEPTVHGKPLQKETMGQSCSPWRGACRGAVTYGEPCWSGAPLNAGPHSKGPWCPCSSWEANPQRINLRRMTPYGTMLLHGAKAEWAEGVATTKHYYGQSTICFPLRPWVQGGRYKVDEGKRVFNLLLVLTILDCN